MHNSSITSTLLANVLAPSEPLRDEVARLAAEIEARIIDNGDGTIDVDHVAAEIESRLTGGSRSLFDWDKDRPNRLRRSAILSSHSYTQ